MVYYECPQCGWQMSEAQYHQVMADLGCPRCQKSFMLFHRHDSKPAAPAENGGGK